MRFFAVIAATFAVRLTADTEALPSAKEIMAAADTDKSGKISFKEAGAALKKLADHHKYNITKQDEERAEVVFHLLDTNHDGEVSKKELNEALGATLDWKEMKDIIKKTAKAHNVKVSKKDMAEAKAHFKKAAGKDGVANLEDMLKTLFPDAAKALE